MEKNEFDFAADPKTLHALERNAELMRAQHIADSLAAAWKGITSLFRTNKVSVETTA